MMRKACVFALCTIVCAGGLLADSSADALPRIAVFGGSFSRSGITRENGRSLVSGDDCHMTAAGYAHIAPLTAEFLRKNTECIAR